MRSPEVSSARVRVSDTVSTAMFRGTKGPFAFLLIIVHQPVLRCSDKTIMPKEAADGNACRRIRYVVQSARSANSWMVIIGNPRLLSAGGGHHADDLPPPRARLVAPRFHAQGRPQRLFQIGIGALRPPHAAEVDLV